MRIIKLKIFRIILVSLIICFYFCPDGVAAKTRVKKKYTVSARSAFLFNLSSQKQLYGKNIYKPVVPASTTKVMTALLVLERLSLDKIATVSKKATLASPSIMGAKENERYRVSDLLHAALMKSANDATIVLAEAVAGSEKEFVKLMNERARQLGCRSTRFANSNGLPTEASQYTTAYDMYLIFREALKYPFFKETLTHKAAVIHSLDGRVVPLRSYNNILFSRWKKKIYGKTGYTRKAKACFVGYFQKDGDILFVAVFGCKSGQRWKDIKHIVTKYGGVSLK